MKLKNSSAALFSIKRSSGAFSLLLLVHLLLSACGGGGSDGPSPQSPVQATAVAGIAAAGAPLAGKVHLCDSSFKSYSSNSAIDLDGSFSIDTTGMKAPFILRADDKDGNPIYYSFARTPGIININPLTNLAVAVAAWKTRTLTPAELYAGHTASDMDAVSDAVIGSSWNIMNSLQPLLALYRAETADPLSDCIPVNRQGLDGLFDDVSFSVSSDAVTITRKDNDSTLFSSSLSGLASAPDSAGLDTDNLPTPKSYPTPGNTELTLKVEGNLPQGTLIRKVIFTVQLPLGISVALDSSDGKGLNAVENTALPIGAAAGSNVYPAPTLSATNNILTVSMSSVAGFGAGDFIKIRCIVSYPSLMAATTPASFTVTSSSLHADINGNQKLKDLTIVPDKFTPLQ